jgi:hypothetical protein
MIQTVYCAGCEAHVIALHRDGETLTETYQRALLVAREEAGYRELAARAGRLRPRLLCSKCIGDVVVLLADAPSPPPTAPA